MDDRMDKNDVLKAVVLLLLGFVVGFATHAFVSVTGTSDIDMLDENGEVMTTEDVEREKIVIPSTKDSNTSDDKVVIPSTKDIETPKDVVKTPEVTIEARPNNIDGGEYTFSVANQPSGDMVSVSGLKLKDNAWVAVREKGYNNGMGNILGAAWLPAGATEGLVELLRATEPNNSYYIVLYVDNGDKKFTTSDDVMVMDGATPLAAEFLTY